MMAGLRDYNFAYQGLEALTHSRVEGFFLTCKVCVPVPKDTASKEPPQLPVHQAT